MPKDYQEVERIVKEFKHFIGADEVNTEWLRTTLTTYGNARELEGVEKGKKDGVRLALATLHNSFFTPKMDIETFTISGKIKTELSAKQ